MRDLGLKVETLEEPLHVSSPLGTRVRVDQICWDCELEISGILLTVDLRVMDKSEFDEILGMDSLTAHRVVIDYDLGGLLLTQKMVFMLCFKGVSMILYPKSCMTLGGIGG